MRENTLCTSEDLIFKGLVIAGLGLLFLLYPLVGHLTDAYLTGTVYN